MILEKNRFLIKTKIEIGDYYELEKEKVYVELREPTILEMFALQEKWIDADGNQNKMLKPLIEILPDLICSHNFYENENNLTENTDVAEEIQSRINLCNFVILEYYEHVLTFIVPSTVETEPKKGLKKEKKPV